MLVTQLVGGGLAMALASRLETLELVTQQQLELGALFAESNGLSLQILKI